MVHVKSETHTLKKVLLHRPGLELERLTPEALERLLFDDIPFLKRAIEEHKEFEEVLLNQGVEVAHLSKLVAESLDEDTEIRKSFIKDFVESGDNSLSYAYKKELYNLFNSIEDNRDLVIQTMNGVTLEEVEEKEYHPLSRLVSTSQRFVLDPVPNLYFTRDPFAIIGDGVSLNHMYSKTRRRETIYGKYIFQYHKDYRDVPLYYNRQLPYHIEGGDIFNLSDKTLLVGISERTTPEAIELLAQNCFADKNCTIDTVAAIYIPSLRAYMHLDTVFTQVDKATFVVHPLITDRVRTFIIKSTWQKDLKVTEGSSNLVTFLNTLMGRDDVKLIYCGGTDSIAAAREQWNDGSNTLCIKPGTIVVYDRNTVTNKILEDNGIQTLEIHSSELSRGRGGPRCMSMPLIRE